jgi:sterol desaturase/sphingolipid hydroxylase (fatty acid hydroxylase superfamily)
MTRMVALREMIYVTRVAGRSAGAQIRPGVRAAVLVSVWVSSSAVAALAAAAVGALIASLVSRAVPWTFQQVAVALTLVLSILCGHLIRLAMRSLRRL